MTLPGLDVSAHSGAIFSDDKAYRYRLWRAWDTDRETVAFCMLNPSTADEMKNDPTIGRCVGFARDWGFGGLEVVNLFAFRATDPKELKKASDPVGPENAQYITRAALESKIFVCAWGNHGAFNSQASLILKKLKGYKIPAFCLGVNRNGSPRHPLYISRDQKLEVIP